MGKRYYDNYDYEEAYKEQCKKLEEAEMERWTKEGWVNCLYRTSTYKSTNTESNTTLLESMVYPSFKFKADMPKTEKKRETSPSQSNLNDKNARRYLIRLANINFGKGDIWATFGWNNAFYQIVQSDDELDSITKKRRSDIYIKAFNTSVKKIAFNSKKSDGFNPQLVVNDEMEAWPGDQGLKQYEVMTSALGARKQPLIISIATAGYVNDGIFDELFKRATAFLKGNSREKRLLPFIYMIDDIEKWDSIEELKKSNPNLGVSVSAEYYLEQIEIARNSISKKVEFMTKFCNIKQNSAVAWLDYWDVMKCVHEEKPLSLEDFKGCYCVGGIDLSRTTDLTAASIVINRDGINHIFTRFYMPQKRYEVAINEDNTPYNIYRDRGFLFISGENQVDYKDVYNWFIELVKVYKIKPLKIGYDRYSANYLVEDLKTAGFHTDDVYQGTNLTPILHEFEGNLKDGLFDFGDNSMLAAHFLNVAVDINLNDSRMKPVKIEKRMRIDGAMSVFDALTMVSKYHNEIGKKLLNISKETA